MTLAAYPPAFEPRQPTAEEITRSWVEWQLRDLGFNDLQVEAMVDAGADWHEAHRLLDAGASHLTVVDLLT